MATSIDQKNFVKTALRLPPDVHEAMHAAAQASGRSYNAEIVHRLEQSLDPESAVRMSKTTFENMNGVMQELLAEVKNLRTREERLVDATVASLEARGWAIHPTKEDLKVPAQRRLKTDKAEAGGPEVARPLFVGNLGDDRESPYEKVIIRSEPERLKQPANKGPTRSPNARKPKP